MASFCGAVYLGALSVLPPTSQHPLPRIASHGPQLHGFARRQAASAGDDDNGAPARASYAAVSLLCMLVMASLFGSRFRSILNRRYWSSLTFIRLIPYLLYFFGIAFDIAAALSVSGVFKPTRAKNCVGAMYVCLVFYVSTKTCVQLFLIERVHAVRAKMKKRLDDWIWLLFMLVLICGFGTIAILAFLAPVGVVNRIDGQCRIGLPRTSVLVLMTYDILINIALTGVFIVMLMPMLGMHLAGRQSGILTSPTHLRNLRPSLRASSSKSSGETTDTTGTTTPSTQSVTGLTAGANVPNPQADHLRSLVGKSGFGAVVMLTATMVNLAFLYKYNGMEHGWMCFACCLLDVTWSVTVIHLLTDGGKDEDRASLVSHLNSSEQRGARYQRLEARRRAQSED